MAVAGSARVGLVGVGFVSGQISFIGRSVGAGISNTGICKKFCYYYHHPIIFEGG